MAEPNSWLAPSNLGFTLGTQGLYSLGYANGYYIVGQENQGSWPTFRYATDPSGTWTAMTFSSAESWGGTTNWLGGTQVQYDGTYYSMLVGGQNVGAIGNIVAYTTDPTGTWTLYTLPSNLIGGASYDVHGLQYLPPPDDTWLISVVNYSTYAYYFCLKSDPTSGTWTAYANGINDYYQNSGGVDRVIKTNQGKYFAQTDVYYAGKAFWKSDSLTSGYSQVLLDGTYAGGLSHPTYVAHIPETDFWWVETYYTANPAAGGNYSFPTYFYGEPQTSPTLPNATTIIGTGLNDTGALSQLMINQLVYANGWYIAAAYVGADIYSYRSHILYTQNPTTSWTDIALSNVDNQVDSNGLMVFGPVTDHAVFADRYKLLVEYVEAPAEGHTQITPSSSATGQRMSKPPDVYQPNMASFFR
jgi:hypothetical protein